MASKSEPVAIGPFVGGLNIYSDPSTIGDTECADINNFDIDLDGTLVSRPPVTMIAGISTLGFRILGYFTWTDGIVYTIVSTSAGTYAYNNTTLAWTTITVTIAATSMVQYANKAFLVSSPFSITTGGSWDPTAGYLAISSMPKGNTATVYKERIYIGSGVGHATPSRLYFSPAGNPGGTWITGTDFQDVNNGDGQNIIEILNYNGAIVVFKQNSTYMFAYDSQPTKGAVQVISSTIGIAAKDCVGVHENNMYLMHAGDIYVVANWNWEQVNLRVPFVYTNAHSGLTHTDYAISIIGNRLLCKYFDTYYMYGLKTHVWSKWTFTADAQLLPGKLWRFPVADSFTGVDKYFAGSSLTNVVQAKSLQVFKDTYSITDSEVMFCSVRSKTYNFNIPYAYKRLFWWGTDLLSKSNISAKLVSVTSTGSSLDVSDSATISNIPGIRMFVKFLKSIRFRQVAFDLSSTVNGTTTTGPLRIYSITAFVSNKEVSNKKIN